MKSLRPLLIATATAILAGACASPRFALPEPLPLPTQGGGASETFVQPQDSAPRQDLQRSGTPGIPGSGNNTLVAGAGGEPIPPLKGGAVNVNIEGMPVPAFINEFFGSILGVGFQMDPQVARMQDLVTLRTQGPQSPQNFYRLAAQVLRTYGVSTEFSSGLVFFNRARDTGGGVTPLIVSGRALPEVPISHRPVFQLMELQAVRATDVVNLLNVAFKDSGLTLQPDNGRNAVILMGKPELVRQAGEAIRVLDRPYMRGRVSARLEPAFVSAVDLSKRLVEVLSAEGYGAAIFSAGGGGGTAILVLPLEVANAVLVFAADRAVLEHAVEWARSIDRPNPTAGSDGLFYYMVKNTRAGEIVKTITGLRSGTSTTREPARDTIDGSQVGLPPVAAAVASATTGAGAGVGGGDLSKGKLSLDEPRNAIIYQGSATDWGRLLPLIQQMDRAPRQVMIEVTVAEVTLNKDQEFGVAWLGVNSDLGKFNGTISSGTLSNSVGGPGLSYLLDIGGQTRASLKALASMDRISVLSTPRLMVKSGEEASFDVGTEVPTVSAQATSGIQTDGNTGLIQTVQYRKTGILLNIKPVVYSDDRVDIELRQEVSEALPVGADSAISSPAIFNRSYSTSLSLKDGSAILIAGLMSQRKTVGDSGVPYLKDVPVLGNLFKTEKRGDSKTELVLMIVPYIIETDMQAEELTRSLSQRFEMLELPITGQPPVPVTPSVPVQP
jgi:general secretion pathway protein D